MRFHAIGLAATLLLATVAHADVPPLGLQECSSKQAGDACERVGYDGKVEGKGKCVEQTCTKLDYANWDRDASPNAPPSATYACRLCTLTKDLASDGGPGNEQDDDEDKDDGGCTLSVGDKTQQRALALSLAAVVALVVRRRRKH